MANFRNITNFNLNEVNIFFKNIGVIKYYININKFTIIIYHFTLSNSTLSRNARKTHVEVEWKEPLNKTQIAFTNLAMNISLKELNW